MRIRPALARRGLPLVQRKGNMANRKRDKTITVLCTQNHNDTKHGSFVAKQEYTIPEGDAKALVAQFPMRFRETSSVGTRLKTK